MLSDIKILFAFRLAISALLIFGSVSCIAEKEVDTPDKVVESALRISTRKAVTRGDEHFADDPHAEGEEALRRISLFFFSDKNSADAAFFTYENDDAGAQTTADLTVRIPNYMLKGRTKVYVYALVNLPDDIAVNAVANTIGSQPATLENLKAVWVSDEGFATRGVVAGTFVMRGDAEVTVGGSGSDMTVEGDIFVERLAAKVRLWADIENILYINTTTGKTINRSDYVTEPEWQAAISGENVETWKSETYDSEGSNVKLYLYNLTTRGRIGGSASGNGYFGDDYPGEDYANRDEMWAYRDVDRSDDSAEAVRVLATGVDIEDEDVESDKYNYTHSLAYYSYPNIWQSTEPTEGRQTYLIVSVPWKKVVADGESGEYRVCYYQIPINALRGTTATSGEVFRIDPNRYYRINVHIAMLGSRDMGKPTEIEAGYEVADWVQNDVNVNIKDRRYLVVNQKEWTMNNASTVEIPFSTSHTTVIDKCYVTYFRYNDIWGYEPESREPEYWQATPTTRPPQHNNGEFQAWVNAAGPNLTEGELTASWEALTNNSSNITGSAGQNIMLYYKRDYFYDEVYQRLNGNGFKYYVGREHPRTYQPKAIALSSVPANRRSEWTQYTERFGIDSVYTYSIDSKNGIITFTHPLVQWQEGRNSGNTSGPADYYVPELNPRTGRLWDEFSRIEITILIRHEDWTNDDGLYRETIHITQYPAVYVEVSHDYGNLSQYNRGGYGGGNEYVRINGLTTAVSTSNSWEISVDGVFGVTNSMIQYNGTNMNPNMYVIHISQFSEDDEQLFDIGDPRSLTSNINLSDNSFEKNPTAANNPNVAWSRWGNLKNYAPVTAASWSEGAVVAGKNTLEHYYPTDETDQGTAGSKENFVAPAIRIASSFGKIQQLNKYEARRRCAAYQEAGRPAGRWRLPTRAEVVYIANMSSDGKIPVLFGNAQSTNAYYWISTGMVNVERQANGTFVVHDVDNPGSVSADARAVRCVYDDWYWLKSDGTPDLAPNGAIETDFYWGDKAKDNPQN